MGNNVRYIIKTVGKLALIAFLLLQLYVMARLYLFASCMIPSYSMSPTLRNGDYIIASLRIPGRREWKEDRYGKPIIERKEGIRKVIKGDVVVFNFPYILDKERMMLSNELYYCKRCAAAPGEEYSWVWKQKAHRIYLPKAEDELVIDSTNYQYYRKCIEYETNRQITCRGNTILLADSVIYSYQFRHDYYFMLGDNTSDSFDSRSWGLLPDDFILGVGKFIWFSKNPHTGKIQWDRMFSPI